MEARELPRGTVTLLFTDIEGSTRLLQELGREGYVRALTQHRRLLREAFTAYGGVEVEMQGDSFHFAFAYARDAVAAAAAGQRALHEHEWESYPIRVRMGLHTGEPMQADGLYAGIDVHRAARVMSVAHGGQVLLSERTADLVEGEIPHEVTLRDLGPHRLKDFAAPQRLFDLVIEGLEAEFPPVQPLAGPSSVLESPRSGSLARRFASRHRLPIAAAAALLLFAATVGAVVAERGSRGDDRKPASPATTAVGASTQETVDREPPSTATGTLDRVAPNSVGLVHRSGRRIVGQVSVGPGASRIVSTSDAIWVALGNETVIRINPRTRAIAAAVAMREPIYDLAADGDDVWVLAGRPGSAPRLARIDAAFNAAHTAARVDVGMSRFGGLAARPAIATTNANLWVTDPLPPGLLRWIDKTSGKVRGSVRVVEEGRGTGPAIVALGTQLWVSEGSATIVRLDTRRRAVQATIGISLPRIRGRQRRTDSGTRDPAGPVQLASGAGAVWLVTKPAVQCCPAATIGTGALHRIDPATDSVTAVTPVDGIPVGVAVGEGAVWVATRAGALLRFDPRTLVREASLNLGGPLGGVGVAAGTIWVSVQDD